MAAGWSPDGLEVADRPRKGATRALEIGGWSHAHQPYVGPPTVLVAVGAALRRPRRSRPERARPAARRAAAVAVVVDHHVGGGTPLLPGGLRGDPGPRVGLAHARARRAARSWVSRCGVDHHDARRTASARPFSTSSGTSWTTTASGGAAAISSRAAPPDVGMDDRVERGQAVGVGRRRRRRAAAGPATRRRRARSAPNSATTRASPARARARPPRGPARRRR